MTVKLWYAGTENMSGGFFATYNSPEEAEDQAISDIKTGRVPGPDRIVGDNDAVLSDKVALEELTAAAKDAE